MSDATTNKEKYPIISESDQLPSLEEILHCLATTRRHSPATVTLQTQGYFVGTPTDLVTISLAPISVRAVFDEGFEAPEYEFDAWLVGADEAPVYVQGALKMDANHKVDECTLYRLAPGEKLRTTRELGGRAFD